MSEWISVEERLPNIGRDVITYDPDSAEVGAGYISRRGFWVTYQPDGVEPSPVTHWTPLPEPPDKEQ